MCLCFHSYKVAHDDHLRGGCTDHTGTWNTGEWLSTWIAVIEAFNAVLTIVSSTVAHTVLQYTWEKYMYVVLQSDT